jgi:hypothetical protein
LCTAGLAPQTRSKEGEEDMDIDGEFLKYTSFTPCQVNVTR